MSFGAGLAALAEIDALKRRLLKLEQQVRQGDESLQPTYLTIDPATGLVSANFSGIVNAEGLTVPAAPSLTFAAPNSIQWEDSGPNGGQVAVIQGAQQGGGGDALVIQASPTVANPATFIALQAQGNSGTLNAGVSIRGGQASGSGSNNVQVSAGAPALTILDDLQRSNFLQQPALQTLFVEVTGGTVTWPGGSNSSGVITVNFSGPAAASFNRISLTCESAGIACFAQVISETLTSINLEALDPFGQPGAGATAFVHVIRYYD